MGPAPTPQLPEGTTDQASGGRTPKLKKSGGGGYSLLLKDSVIYGAGRALQKFLVALLLPLYTAFLSQSDYGLLGMVVAVTTFIDVFVTLGFDIAFQRFYFDDKSEAAHKRVITNTFAVSTVYPAILLGVIAALMPRIAPLIMGDSYSSGDWIYFDVALLTLFFDNLNDVPFTLFRLDHRPWMFSGYTVGRVVIQVPLSVLFVGVFSWGPMGVLAANLVTSAGIQATLLPTYIRRVQKKIDPRLMRAMLAFAVPALFTGVSFYWLKLSDRFFLLHYQGKAEVGLYTVANSLSQPLYLLMMAFRLAWPQWHYAELSDPERHRHLVARSSTYFMGLNGAALAGLGAFMPLLVHTLVSSSYWEVGPTTFVLSVSIVLYSLYYVFWVGSNVAKKNQLIPVFFLIASAVNIALNFWLVPQYGMWAAAWTHVIGFLILAVTVYFYSEHYYPIPYEWGRLLKILLATAVSLGGAWGMAQLTGLSVDMAYDELVMASLAQIPALLLFPLVLWLTGFLTAGERQRVVGLFRRPAVEGELGQAELSRDDVLAAEDEETELEARAQLDITEGGRGTL